MSNSSGSAAIPNEGKLAMPEVFNVESDFPNNL